jgi:hypothetical protein
MEIHPRRSEPLHSACFCLSNGMPAHDQAGACQYSKRATQAVENAREYVGGPARGGNSSEKRNFCGNRRFLRYIDPDRKGCRSERSNPCRSCPGKQH